MRSDAIEARRRREGLPALGLALALAAIAGCGGPADGFERFPVEGTVTLDGAPLKAGTINFIAQQEGASSTAEVEGGAFRLDGDDGLSPGPYRVEIFSVQATGKRVPDADNPGTLVDEITNVVPQRYNVQSTLKAEIPPGGPEGPLPPFALTGAPDRRPKR